IRPQVTIPLAAQGDVQVVAQPGTQADMPASPEILQAGREIWLGKVHHKIQAQKLCTAARDARISREIAVDLPGKGKHPQQDNRQIGCAELPRERGIGDQCAVISNDDFAKYTLKDEY